MEIIFHSHAFKTHFHKKGSAPSLILKVRVFGTRKWLICVILENFKMIRRLKIQTGVSIISVLMFLICLCVRAQLDLLVLMVNVVWMDPR